MYGVFISQRHKAPRNPSWLLNFVNWQHCHYSNSNLAVGFLTESTAAFLFLSISPRGRNLYLCQFQLKLLLPQLRSDEASTLVWACQDVLNQKCIYLTVVSEILVDKYGYNFEIMAIACAGWSTTGISVGIQQTILYWQLSDVFACCWAMELSKFLEVN